MNSFNHYAYGAIGDWMYRVVAGLDTDPNGPGYKMIRIQPHIGKGLTQASATLNTYYGKASSGWKVDGNNLTLDVEIPPNTTAVVYISSGDNNTITENGVDLSSVKDINVTGKEKGYTIVKLGSGSYHFTSSL